MNVQRPIVYTRALFSGKSEIPALPSFFESDVKTILSILCWFDKHGHPEID
jgi:hypothetical protein